MKKIATITLPIFIFAFTVLPVFAEGNDVVRNYNRASVMNGVMIGANTGGNIADGSYAGNGGSGGAISNNGTGEEGSGDVRDSSTGNGGNGGNSGDGGTIFTGDATAEVMIENNLNTNRTEISRCGCTEDVPEEETDQENDNIMAENGDGNVRIVNRNLGRVGNMIGSMSDTGMNYAYGSEAGTGGSGGKIQNTGEGDVDTSTTGDGAIGGNSAAGGLIQTGVAVSRIDIMNVINTNVSRLSR